MSARLDRAGATTARQRVLRSKDRFWEPSDFAMPDSTILHLLGGLVESGEMRRVRRGLYWRGIKTPLGMAPPSTEALVKELAGSKGVGPAGLSAANFLRLSTQVPRRAQYAVPGRAPTPTDSLQFVSRAARKGRAANGLTPPEVAALEVLDGWERVVEVTPGEAFQRLAGLISDHTLRADKLAKAAKYESGPTQARLKVLFDMTGHKNLAGNLKVTSKSSRSLTEVA